MNEKQNDLFLDSVLNPTFTLGDFQLLGFTADNTSIQDKDSYRTNKIVTDTFTNDAGNFDEAGFSKAYDTALKAYNAMATDTYVKNDLAKQEIVYSKDDFFAPIDQRAAYEPEFIRQIVYNPTDINVGLGGIGYVSEPTQSDAELAQANAVLLNPVDVEKNGADPVWGKNPHDGFFDYFTDTLVLATYQEDGEHKDILTGKMVKHQKGERKLNDNGQYFYETLDGRDIYGKEVLYKSNILTEEGSWLNSLDFFDSDDLKKSTFGTVMKELALVGTMFVPYVGPWVTGLGVALNSAKFLSVLGKMATGNDNSTLSAIEGWTTSMMNQGNVSEYAKHNPWSLENMIILAGDVASQLKEQRFIFEKVPAIFKGNYVYGKNAEATKLLREKKLGQYLDKEQKLAKAKVDKLAQQGMDQNDLVKAWTEYAATATSNAQSKLDSFIKGYNNLGSIIGKSYMTMLTVGDTYGEAKFAGASDLDATLLTLGYAAGEYAILNTGIGEWIMPELRQEAQLNRRIRDLLTNQYKETTENIFKKYKGTFKNLSNEGKKEYAKRIIGLGKKLATDVYSELKEPSKRVLATSFAHGLGEGVEEVSEELLADFSKGCYDIINWIRGNDVRLNSFGYSWENGERNWSLTDLRDRYGLSFVGGMIGGSITSAGTTFYNNSVLPTTPEAALQQLIQIRREDGNFDKFRRSLNKVRSFGNKYLSTKVIQGSDGLLDFMPGTNEDNLDKSARQHINNILDNIDQIITTYGSGMSNNSFLSKQTLNDLRFNALHQSTTALRYIQEYNNLNSDIYRIVDEINTKLKAVDTNGNGKIEDYEVRKSRLSEDDKKYIAKLEQELNEKQKRLKDLLDNSSLSFIEESLFELTPIISQTFLPKITLQSYTKSKYGKKYDELDEETQNKIQSEYNKFKELELRDQVPEGFKVFKSLLKSVSNTLKSQDSVYAKVSEKAKAVNQILNKLNFIHEIDSNGNEISIADQLEQAKLNQDVYFNIEKIGTALDIEKIKQLQQKRQQDLSKIDEHLSKEDYQKRVEDINTNYFTNIAKALITNAESFVKPFIDQGFINSVTQARIDYLLGSIHKAIFPLYNKKQKKVEMGIETTNPYSKQLFDLLKLRNSFNNLDNSPLEKNLNEFQKSIGLSETDVTELEEKLEILLNTDSVTGFKLSKELKVQLDNALRSIQMYQTILEASKVDNIGLDNRWGYTVTVNEIANKQGTPTNYAEIDSEFANVLWQDLQTLYNRLLWFKKIYNLNQGNKIKQHEIVAAVSNKCIAKKLRYIISIGDPDKKDATYQKLSSVLENCDILKSLIDENKDPNLSPNDYAKLEQESIKLGDAVYEFFQDKLDNPEELAKIINPQLFPGIYTNSNNLLNENTEEIEDKAFIAWLIGRAALKTSDFYSMLKGIINPESKLMALPTQELAAFNNLASIVNGNVFTTMYKVYRQSMYDDWKSKKIEDRKSIIKELGYDQANIELYSSKELEDKCFIFLNALRYSHITFTEGGPGTGKTGGVTKLTIELLRQFYPDVIKNVHVIHAVDNKNETKRSKEFFDSLSIEGKYFNFVDYLNKISVGYKQSVDGKIDPSQYKHYEHGELRTSLDLANNADIPSLIIIDEATLLNIYELDILNKFAEANGITILAMGDFDQNKTVGQHPYIDNSIKNDYLIETLRSYFISGPKLGVSLRTDNNIKTNNTSVFQQAMNDRFKQQCELHYYSDESGFYGDKVFTFDQTQDITETIDQMISTLEDDETVVYAYEKTNSEIYKKYENNPKVEFIPIDKIQGLEKQYYIIETDNHIYESLSKSQQDILSRCIYTGITRAQQGSILITSDSIANKIKSRKVNEKIDEDYTPYIAKYSNDRKERLEKIISDTVVPNIIQRTKIIDEPSVELPKEESPESVNNPPVRLTKEQTIQKYGDMMGIDSFTIEVEGQNIPLYLNSISSIVDNNIITTPVITLRYFNPLWNSDIDTSITLVRIHDFIQPFYLDRGVWKPFFGLTYDIYDNKIIDLDVITNEDSENYEIFNLISNKLHELFGESVEPTTFVTEDLINYVNNLTSENISELMDSLKEELNKLKENPNFKPEDQKLLSYFPTENTEEDSEEQITLLLQGSKKENSPIDASSEQHLLEYTTKDNATELNDEQVIIEKNKPIHITSRGYTYNCLELGAVVDSNDNIINDGKYTEARIDGYNGLVKIDKIVLNDPKASISAKRRIVNSKKGNDYLKRIAVIRGILFNRKNKSDIISELKDYLGINVENINFALKCSPPLTEKIKNDPNRNHLIDSDKYLMFDHNKNERAHYSNSKDTRSDEIMPHKFVAILYNEELGEFLEIPLFTLSSPLTIMNYRDKDGNAPFAEVAAVFDTIYNETNQKIIINTLTSILSSNHTKEKVSNIIDRITQLLQKGTNDIHTAVQAVIIAFNKDPLYKELIDLFKLFNFTYSGLFRIQDNSWTPAKDLINLGSMFTLEKGVYQYANGFSYNANMYNVDNLLSITEFANQSHVSHITPILTSLVSESGINPSHPIVLVSFDPDLNDDYSVVSYYEKQIQSGTEESNFPKVKAMYIMPPIATAAEYFDHLDKKLKKDPGENRHIGNLFTPYRILSAILNDSDATGKIFTRSISPKMVEDLREMLKPIEELENDENIDRSIKYAKMAELLYNKGKYPLFKNEVSLITYLDNVLLTTVYDIPYKSILSMTGQEVEHSINQDIVNYIEKVLKNSRIQIFHDVPLDPSTRDTDRLGKYFIKVKQGNNWTLDGKSCRIHGKLDSYVFSGDFSNFIQYCVSNIKYYNDTKNLRQYINSKINPNYKRKGAKKPIENLFQKALNKYKQKVEKIIDISTIPDVTSAEELEISKYKIIEELSKQGRVGIINNDSIEYSDPIPNMVNPTLKFVNVNPSTGNTIYQLRDRNGQIYIAEYNPSDSRLEYWDANIGKETVQATPIRLNIKGLQSYKDSINTTIEAMTANNVKKALINKFKNILNATNTVELEQIISDLNFSTKIRGDLELFIANANSEIKDLVQNILDYKDGKKIEQTCSISKFVKIYV